ncbi:MAG: selenide, water dikinase SelD, partial [Rikenellaceae bacterium]
MIDLLKHSDQGGCSAKIPQDKLMDILSGLKPLKDNNILVDVSTSDDAGVYRINDEMALIVTTDFFPPICSDPYEFGQIAAANSLSDIYAMGGKPLLVLNLNMFPSVKLPMEVLGSILEGGQLKINEAGAFVMGGHTIEDQTIKYGLAVVGTCHPDHLITNSGLEAGQKLILTKPLGIGVLIAARRMGICSDEAYNEATTQMKTLNKAA